jgi:glycosyltransferase 2 family protein
MKLVINTLKKPNFIKVIISSIAIFLFLWILFHINWTLVLSYVKRIPWWIIICIFLLMVLGQLFNALRWFIILKAGNIQIKLTNTILIVFSGAFASNFLPSTIGGDIYRVIALQKYCKEQHVCLNSIIIDRMTNLSVYILLTPFSIHLLTPIFATKSIISEQLIFGTLFPKLITRADKFIKDVISSFSLIMHKPTHLFLAWVASFFSDIVVIFGTYLLTQGLGMHVSFYQVIGVTVITYILTLLPISINGYGIREIVLTSLYSFLGNSVEQATILAIVSRFLMTSVTLLGVFGLSDIYRAKNSNIT